MSRTSSSYLRWSHVSHLLPYVCFLEYRQTDECYRGTYYPPHKHAGLTTHLLLHGDMTIWYPKEEDREKKTFGPGARVDVDAGRVHEVWIGDEGCTMIIGE